MNEYGVALASSALGIAGTLLGVLFTYRLSMESAKAQLANLRAISKLEARYSAESLFVSAFSEELAAIEGGEELNSGLDDFLRRAHHAKHKTAAIEFRRILDNEERLKFDIVWKQYHSGQATQDMIETGMLQNEAMFIEYSGYPFEGDPYKKARERINLLLAFAKFE